MRESRLSSFVAQRVPEKPRRRDLEGNLADSFTSLQHLLQLSLKPLWNPELCGRGGFPLKHTRVRKSRSRPPNPSRLRIRLSLSPSPISRDSLGMERVDDWLIALDGKPNPPRPQPKPATKESLNTLDLTASSSASSSASSASSIRIIEKPRPRPLAPIFAPRPQAAVPLRAAERVVNAVPTPFVSNAASFGMTAKQRAMLSMKVEHQRLGVPIGVPVNPAYKRPVPPPAFGA